MKRISPFLIIAAGSMWGSMGVFVRYLNTLGFQALDIITLRATFAAIVFLLILLIYDRKQLKFNLKDSWCFFGTGILGILFFNACYYYTIEISSLSAAAILLYTAPIFVMVMSIFIFREKMTKTKIAALSLAFAGCVLVSGITSGDSHLSLTGFFVGLCSGFGYALYTIFSKFAVNKEYSPLTISAYTFLFASIGGLLTIDREFMLDTFVAHPSLIPFCFLFAACTTVVANTIYLCGLNHTESGTASVLASVEPVAATVLGIIFFSEIPNILTISGISLVLMALFILSRKHDTGESLPLTEGFINAKDEILHPEEEIYSPEDVCRD